MRSEINSIRIVKRIPESWEKISTETKRNMRISKDDVSMERYVTSAFLNNISITAIIFQEEIFKRFNIGGAKKFLKRAKCNGFFIIADRKVTKENLLIYVDAIYLKKLDDLKFAMDNEKLIYIPYNGLAIVSQPNNIGETGTLFIEKDVKNEEQLDVLYEKLMKRVTQIKNSKI